MVCRGRVREPGGPAWFDAPFLGVGVPVPVDPVPTVLLDYTHFSVLLPMDRRLAAVTGVGIDVSALQISTAWHQLAAEHPPTGRAGGLQ